MIPDSKTNCLYLSPLLKEKYPDFYDEFSTALTINNITENFLPHTRDVWCADYMPVQVSENEYIQFKYYPQYLREPKYREIISKPSLICQEIGISPKVEEIILDGGNIVKSRNKAIITTRIFQDNPELSINKLTNKLVELLKIDQVIYVPEQPEDYTGHGDGMVRFLDENAVLLNDFTNEPDREFVLNLQIMLQNAGLEIIEIPTSIYENEDIDDATGDYMNYLQMHGMVFLPVFNRNEDDQVIKQFEGLFTGSKIIPVLSNELSKDGGIINCVTWNIEK